MTCFMSKSIWILKKYVHFSYTCISSFFSFSKVLLANVYSKSKQKLGTGHLIRQDQQIPSVNKYGFSRAAHCQQIKLKFQDSTGE